MAINDTNEKLESKPDIQAKPSEAAAEASVGKQDLVEKQKTNSDYLKAGGKSGITGDFGKPIFFDSGTVPIADLSRKAPAETVQEMGRAGDRSKDAGLGKPEKPDVTLDDKGRVSDYKLPDGQKFQIKYGDDGQPSSITMTPEGGQPKTFVKNEKGRWVDANTGKEERIESVHMEKDGSVEILQKNYVDETKTPKVLHDERKLVISPDGHFVEKDLKFTDGKQKVHNEIEPDGTAHTRFRDQDPKTGEEVGPELEKVTKPGSHISEVKQTDGTLSRYELQDDQGHITKVDVTADGHVTMTKGDHTVQYEKVEKGADGSLKLVSKDGSTVEVKQDGTEIHRDKSGKVTELCNSDGETTKFKRGPGGKVTELTVTDGQGKVVETSTKGIEINDKDGTYTIERDQDHKLERKADGTERLLDKDGKPVETNAEKLIGKFKHLTPEQEHQLRQDLADIDKMPPEQRKKVYESLDRIARNDEHPEEKMRLTGQQARELTVSLAHQIAHPESINQGDKMTCAVANAEETMARRHPEVYADMVAKLATEGKYTTVDGKTIEAQKADDTHLAGKSDAYSQRSYASELFQNGAAQLGMKDGDTYKSYPADAPEIQPRPSGVTPSNDTGERVVHKDGSVSKFNGFDAQAQADILNHLAPADKYKATDPIQTPAQLEQAIKENGGVPLNVGIHLGPESSFTGMGGDSGAAGSGYHAVNITRIETGPDGKKYVYYENPAGGTDHSYPNGTGVPIDDFVKAMQGGETKMRALVKQGKN